MTKKEAIDILVCLGCCSFSTINCNDCPRWNEKLGCLSWSGEEVEEAVKVLKGDNKK